MRIMTCRPAGLILALMLSACANHNWAPGPNVNAADFEPTKARCSMMARHAGGSFAVAGDPNFVAGAALGNAIGEVARTQQDFNDCMVARGWVIDDRKPLSADEVQQKTADRQAKIRRIREIGKERMACVAAVRAERRYAVLAPHQAELETGRFTMTELANRTLPTPAESTLLASFIDDLRPCRDNSISALEQVSPPVANVVRDGMEAAESNALLLVKREIPWGEWASRVESIGKQTKLKLEQVRL